MVWQPIKDIFKAKGREAKDVNKTWQILIQTEKVYYLN